jgi:ABC-2 type transport system permease protein
MMFLPSIRFRTMLRREVTRFWLIKRQTILTPLLETYLYIAVFGASLGSRVGELNGVPYQTFILPGLIMMAMAMNSFANNVASVFQQRFQRAIDDQLTSPLANIELVTAFTLGGFLRGAIVATVTFLTASTFVDLPITHPLLLLASLTLIGLFFAMLGVLLGTIAESFDNISLYQSFILQPLIFLGGVFYSVTLLPEPFKTITHFNPVFYMINMVRYGFLGKADVEPWFALSILFIIVVVLYLALLRLFKSGYKLRF